MPKLSILRSLSWWQEASTCGALWSHNFCCSCCCSPSWMINTFPCWRNQLIFFPNHLGLPVLSRDYFLQSFTVNSSKNKSWQFRYLRKPSKLSSMDFPLPLNKHYLMKHPILPSFSVVFLHFLIYTYIYIYVCVLLIAPTGGFNHGFPWNLLFWFDPCTRLNAMLRVSCRDVPAVDFSTWGVWHWAWDWELLR